MRLFFLLKNKTVIAGLVIAALSAPLSVSAYGADLRGVESDFEKVIENVGPTVVTVAMERTGKIIQQVPIVQGPFNQYIRNYFGQNIEREFKQQGLGSGVIYDKRGFILTNQHVIEGANKITVILPDSRAFPAQVLGEDRRRDLAVLKIEAPDLPVAELGDSDKIKQGQWAIAIGNPFGYIVRSPQPTITVGVISALHRSLPVFNQALDKSYVNLIQTDAAINPGNSGGPLCDINGKVIAINVAMLNQGGGNVDMGFAIPINTVKAILGELESGKKIASGWMGIGAQDISPEMANYLGLSSAAGAMIAAIENTGPAARAGIRPGDVVVRFNGDVINNTMDLMDKINKTTVDEVIDIDVVRDKKPVTIKVTIGPRPEGQTVILKQEEAKTAKGLTADWRGLRVSGVTDELAARLSLTSRNGVVITDMSTQGAAYSAGLRPGDVIKEINRQPISTIDDFKKAIAVLKGNALIQTEKGYYIVEEEK
jgi:serine protease Do